MTIGVLALQGAVIEHIKAIQRLGEQAVAIKTVQQLEKIEGLIIPGGESTAIGKLMKLYGFVEAIMEFSNQGKPVFGTCAGLILIAKKIEHQDWQHIPLLDITVERNAFGRQKESFETNLAIQDVAPDFRAVFIRAPIIRQIGKLVQPLATHNGDIVAVQQGTLLGASFHPELTDDDRLHAHFLKMVAAAREKEFVMQL